MSLKALEILFYCLFFNGSFDGLFIDLFVLRKEQEKIEIVDKLGHSH